jgi:tRNA(adenine34) deaminase
LKTVAWPSDADRRGDEKFMRQAIKEAERAGQRDEVPIGAVVVLDGKIIGRGYNQPVRRNDPTAHAEIIALRKAARKIGNYRLVNATLYVTIEPCAMCAGAMVHARIRRLVYGAEDAKAGGVKSVFQICTENSLNHQVEIEGGMLADECRALLQSFFKRKRKL